MVLYVYKSECTGVTVKGVGASSPPPPPTKPGLNFISPALMPLSFSACCRSFVSLLCSCRALYPSPSSLSLFSVTPDCVSREPVLMLARQALSIQHLVFVLKFAFSLADSTKLCNICELSLHTYICGFLFFKKKNRKESTVS
jgi:hypothetical protein